MSISEQITTEVGTSAGDTVLDSPVTACLEPGSVHLLMADTALAEQHRHGFFLAVCGAELTADRLPPWECPQGCGCEADRLICPDCALPGRGGERPVSALARQGTDQGTAPGIVPVRGCDVRPAPALQLGEQRRDQRVIGRDLSLVHTWQS